MILSAAEEAQIIDALTTIDWTEDAYTAAISVIEAALKCSDAHARRVLEDIYIKKQLLREIKQLEHELAHELPAEIKKAVALGDLSENAEYHMAKQRQEFVNARLGQLKKRMAELSLVNLSNIPRDKAGFGSTVVVYDSTKDEELVYRLVTSEESDVTKGLISTTSPIGRALLGKKEGDTTTVVTPNGKRELEILKLVTIHDAVE